MRFTINEGKLKRIVSECISNLLLEGERGRIASTDKQIIYQRWKDSNYDTEYTASELGYSAMSVVNMLRDMGYDYLTIIKKDSMLKAAYDAIQNNGDLSNIPSGVVTLAKKLLKLINNRNSTMANTVSQISTPEQKIAGAKLKFNKMYPSACKAMSDGARAPEVLQKAQKDSKITHAPEPTQYTIAQMYKVFNIKRIRGRIPLEQTEKYQEVINKVFPMFAQGMSINAIKNDSMVRALYQLSAPTLNRLFEKYQEYITLKADELKDYIESNAMFRQNPITAINIWLSYHLGQNNTDDIKRAILKKAYGVEYAQEIDFHK